MIKLNHKHPLVDELVHKMINEILANTHGECLDIDEQDRGIVVTARYKGYSFKYYRDKETAEATILDCWQLDDCENPIFEV